MTDKEKVIKELKEALDSLDITNKYRLNLIRAIEYLQEEPVSEDLDVGKGEKNRSTKEDCLGCDRLRIVDFKKTDGEIVQVYMCVGLLDIPCPKGYG